MHTFYIIGPDDGGEGVYSLIVDTGERLASHFCSHRGFAPFDLEGRRTASRQQWRDRFGEYRVAWIGDDDLTAEELARRSMAPADQGEEGGAT